MRILFVLILVLVGSGCKRDPADPGDKQPPVNPEPTSPKDTVLKWAKAFESRTAEDILRFYADTEDLTVTFSSGEEFRGYAMLSDMYTKRFRDVAYPSSQLSEVTSKEDGDAASVTCRHRIDFRLVSDDMRGVLDIHTALDLKKHNDAWRIVREKSTVIPGVPRLQLTRLRLSQETSEGFEGRIESVGQDGTLKLDPPLVYEGKGPAERYYVGVVWRDLPTKLFRVLVTEDRAKQTATVRVAPAAADQLKKGEEIRVGRYWSWSDEQLKLVPDLVPVQDGRKPEPPIEGMTAKDSASLKRSLNNLKNIGVALHHWADTHGGRFPPAVIYGPDTQPWHSWRVLLLPYLEQANLYKLYRFDEPWDGPNNKRLLDAPMPIYRDPIHGDSNDSFTHYAAVTGPGTAFPAEGVKTKDPKAWVDNPNRDKSGRARMPHDFKDGTSNSLLIGSVGPGHKIPWTKPEDVPFTETFPLPGKPGSFAAPYRSARGIGGVFLRPDGSVTTISTDVDPAIWRSLWLIADGKPRAGPTGIVNIPDLLPPPPFEVEQEPAVVITWQGGKPSATYVMDTVPAYVPYQDLEKVPVGIKVVHDPNPAPATVTGKAERRSYTWWHKIAVSATDAPVRIRAFGKFTWRAEDNSWVAWGHRPLTPDIFARWYDCPDALLQPGKVYVDRTAWSFEPELSAGKVQWYFLGVDDKGRRVKGDAIVELKAEVGAKK